MTHDLESVTQAIEELLFTKGAKQKEFSEQITRLQVEEKRQIMEIDEQIKAAEAIQGMLLGDDETAETTSFTIFKKKFNPKVKTSWVINRDKEQEKRMIKHLKESNIGLIKTVTKESLLLNDFKDLVAEGTFSTTDEGLVVDENGQAIPGILAEVKPDEIKYKVKGL